MNISLPQHFPTDEQQPGFSAFVLPEALGKKVCERALVLLESIGFEIVRQIKVGPQELRSLVTYFPLSSEEGNSSPYSGDECALLVFATDVMPRQAGRGVPFDNLRIIGARRITALLLAEGKYRHPVRMTSCSSQAWAVLRTVDATSLPKVGRIVRDKRLDFATDPPLAVFTAYGDRAKVELIEFHGRKAVRKTYRSTALHLLAKEVQVMRELGGKMPEIPCLLAHGNNFLVMEFLEGVELKRERGERPQPLPLVHVRRIVDFLERCIAEGYDPIDLKPGRNVVYSASHIGIFDFEYWRKSYPACIDDAYCLAGVPADDTGDQPGLRTIRWADPYTTGWYPYVCLSKHSLLHDSPWLQHVKRPWFVMHAYLQWATRMLLIALARTKKARFRGASIPGSKLIGATVALPAYDVLELLSSPAWNA